MSVQQRSSDQKAGFVSYIVTWIVGMGIFALLVLVAIAMIQE